jgi:hypothetical protein
VLEGAGWLDGVKSPLHFLTPCKGVLSVIARGFQGTPPPLNRIVMQP